MPALSPLRILGIVLANILIPIACVIFANGFFPYKPFLPGLASYHDVESNEELRLLGNMTRPPRIFDKVVLMVVDALRRSVQFYLQ